MSLGRDCLKPKWISLCMYRGFSVLVIFRVLSLLLHYFEGLSLDLQLLTLVFAVADTFYSSGVFDAEGSETEH